MFEKKIKKRVLTFKVNQLFENCIENLILYLSERYFERKTSIIWSLLYLNSKALTVKCNMIIMCDIIFIICAIN